ncbi:hypothetical protein COCNU_16G002870 [Cocos nucifera]|uniref:Uncharacterized protein n=1 Tax=Cocos nucifera TaxID=13894 RepID=A0A8K0NDN2_COCNU|nr:hypothetical protein COCNU_16G002870 [Cocos nucifera]
MKKNPASSSDSGNSTLTTFGAGGNRRSGRGSRGGRSRFKTRDPSKIRCYRYDELEHQVKNCPQLKDRTRTTAATTSSESEDDILKISNEISSKF